MGHHNWRKQVFTLIDRRECRTSASALVPCVAAAGTEVAFRKALEFNPDYPSAHLQLGRVYLMQSNPDAALREMQREEEPLRRFGLALTYHRLGRKKLADKALADFLDRDKRRAAF